MKKLLLFTRGCTTGIIALFFKILLPQSSILLINPAAV